MPTAAAPQSHARTSSFFSFRHKQQQQQRPDSSSGPPQDFGPAPPMGQSQSMGPARDQPDPSQTTIRTPSLTGGQPRPPPPVHPEIRSVVQLTLSHARKVYFSGPLIKRVERTPDGQRPSKDDGWVDVWAQLGGTTLSIWDMREIEEANKQGREVPPVYLNVTDAFIQVLGAITIPAVGDQPAQKYTNVLTLNTAGSNLLLFSCPSTQALIAWSTALRLASWEKSRLEEIYTAHLIRITLPSGRDTRSSLLRGRMEGWARIRVSGQTDWKRMWMVISAGSGSSSDLARSSSNDGGGRPSTAETPRKKRMSHLFSRDHQDEPLPQRPLLALYASPKSKDRKQPLLTLRELSQAFAVYPERPELISRSTLMKLEGHLGDEETGGSMRNRQGWLLVMPELEPGNTQPSEMLKWLVAVHDAFELYGRPKSYTWDPREQSSMMFGYPVGPAKDLLFLDCELAQKMDPREDRTSAVRARLLSILAERMSVVDPAARKDGPPALPPIVSGAPIQQQEGPGQVNGETSHLLQLSFDAPPPPQLQQPMIPEHPIGRALTPIVERSHSHSESHGGSRSRAASDDNVPLASMVARNENVGGSGLELPLSASPPPSNVESRHASEETQRGQVISRPDSKLTPGAETSQTRSETTGSNDVAEVMGVKLPFSPQTSPEIPSFSTPSTTVSSPQSSLLGRRSPYQSPGSPGLHGPPSGASPSTPGRTKSPVPASPTYTVLTSPHSVLEKDLPSIQSVQTQAQETPQRLSSPPPVPSRSPVRTPYVSAPPVPPVPDKPTTPLLTPPAAKPSAQDTPNENDFTAALFYMQQFEEKPPPPRRVPTTISEASDISPASSDDPQPSSQLHSSVSSRFAASQPLLRGAGVPGSEGSLNSLRAPLGRKPSGARAQPTNSRVLNPDALFHPSSSPEQPHLHKIELDTMPNNSKSTLGNTDDVNADALAALSFLDHNPTVAPPQRLPEILATKPVPSPPPRQQPSPQSSENAHGSSENTTQYRSSFALSRQAAERKARLQAQQAAHQAAVHRPGRANGKRSVSGPRSGVWNDSSEEEEEDEEEEDDDDDVDSDDGPSTLDSKRPSQAAVPTPLSSSMAAPAPGPAQEPVPAPVPTAPTRPLRPHSRTASPAEMATATDANPYAQLRHPRNLPPVPRPQTQGTTGMADDYLAGVQPARRIVSDQRARTPDDGAIARSHSDFPAPAGQRQNIWTQVLEPGRQPGANPLPDAAPPPQKDTFIRLEPASVSMTKAFTPHGLLSAGMQDKQDRSAKRQEELARETGASLINVPNKPPPPQTGLLGAITAHERDRKREGGVGATLTEREREKRLAEDRQRKLDELQRQQLEMAQSGMYGGQPFPNYNPMMANPMMMGMNPMMTGANPMMTGGFMGYPNMMPGYGAQQYMFAQQAAQAAYQQAMMAAFSAAGTPDGMQGGPAPMSPMMTGMGFDPRMSMMGMPMMGSPMPMGGMGVPMGSMPGMGPMGMQMTGGSAFDPRFSAAAGGFDENLRPPGPPGGQQGPGHNSSRNSSAGQGSPAGLRPVDVAAGDRPRDSLKS